MTLPLPPAPVPPPDSPSNLYERLQVTEPGLSDLWVHQGTALERYYADQLNNQDVALELPTGSGKTLVGLLIAEWRRLALGQRVAYACVNNQLADQATIKAAGYGMAVVQLTGPKAQWDPAAAAAFRGGQAVAITNYHHVFNYWSGVDAAQTLVFDDAHGGEDPVANTWAMTMRSYETPELYTAVLGVLIDALSRPFAALLNDFNGDPRTARQIELVPPTAMPELTERLLDALTASVTEGSHNFFALQTIQGALDRCLAYVSPLEILIRPFIPPTRELRHFANASQRLYMSATLGAGGELERAFGVDRIHRIPADTGQQRSGRRLILMPGLRIDDAPADDAIRAAIAATPRTTLIAPSDRALDEAAEALLPDGVQTFNVDEIEAFVNSEPAALVLANRYDGIDLPGKQCELIVLSGLPAYGHAQERFLFETVGATRALTERIRTRIIQGAGRATRNRQDFAAVIFRSEPLLRFIQRDESRSEMRPELQVELELGEFYSRGEVALADLLSIFWKHADGWQQTETYIREQVAARGRVDDPVSTALPASAPHEVHAWWSCWQGDLQSATDAALSAVAQLTGETLRAYRALWEYFAANWAAMDAGEQPEPARRAGAQQLRTRAEATARTLRWFPRFADAPEQVAVGPEFDARAARTVAWMRRVNTRRRRFDEVLALMRQNVGERDATRFHQGLETLGDVLGFEVWRDDGSTACPDVVWRDEARTWILFEAKTLQEPERPLGANDVRQANSHDNWMEAEKDWTPRPNELLTVIVSDRTKLAEAADVVADEDVALIPPATLEAIADRAMLAMAHLRGLPSTLTDDDLAVEVSTQLSAHQLDTASLLAELGAQRLRMA